MSGFAASEEEEIEKLKYFWNAYGRLLVLTLVLSIAGYCGFYYWDQHRTELKIQASHQYTQLSKALQKMQQPDQQKAAHEEVKRLGQQMIQQYSTFPQAAFAGFALAKVAVDEADYESAKARFLWVKNHFDDPFLQFLAISRLVRIQIEQKLFDEALAALENRTESGPYRASFEELKGDVFWAKGDKEQALNAYQVALPTYAADSNHRIFLQMKLDELNGLEVKKTS